MPILFLAFFFNLGFAFSAQFDFTGTVQINGCSGFLFRFEHSKDSDQALIMTAGHCASVGRRLNSGEYVYHMKSQVPVRFLNANGSVGPQVIYTDELSYATVTGTDISIYALKSSYSQIMNQFATTPLILSSRRPKLGQQIQVLSGQLQRGYACFIAAFVYQLKEDDYVWHDSLRYSRTGCQTVGGTSGAPVIDITNNKVVGINNTGNLSGDTCTGNNACEVSADGNISFEKGASYGQQTYEIYSCLDNNRHLNLNLSGCRLFH